MATINLEQVRLFMQEKGYSEVELAKAMGVTYSYVFRVMRGKRQPGGKFIEGLISAGMLPENIFMPLSLPHGNTATG